MNTPILLTGLTLILWGWQAGQIWLGAVLALLAEGSRLVSRRWLFSASDLRRVVMVSNLLLALLLLYAFTQASNQYSGRIAHLLVQWLPLPLYPLLLLQAYGAEDKIDIRSLTLLKRSSEKMSPGAGFMINLAWPYWGICLL